MAAKRPWFCTFVFMHMQRVDMQRLLIHYAKNVLVALYIGYKFYLFLLHSTTFQYITLQTLACRTSTLLVKHKGATSSYKKTKKP
jgi:hypothetical protein